MLTGFRVSHRSLSLCSLFFNLFPFCSLSSILFIVLPPSLLSLLFVKICLWILLVNFKFQLLYFLVPEFLFGFFLSFLFHHWYFNFIHVSFSWLFPHLPSVLQASIRQLFLKSLSSSSAIRSFSGTVSVDWFIFFNALWFYFLFLVKNWTSESNTVMR